MRRISFSPGVSTSIARDVESPEAQHSGSSYVLRAPSGYDSDCSHDDYREATPAFSITGPGSDSDEDATSPAPPWSSSYFSATPGQRQRLRSVAVTNLPWTDTHAVRELERKLQISAAQDILNLELALEAVDSQEAADLKELIESRAARLADAADMDGASAGASAANRAALLERLKQQHQAKATAGDNAIAEAAAKSTRRCADLQHAQANATAAAAKTAAAADEAIRHAAANSAAAAAAVAAATGSASSTSGTSAVFGSGVGMPSQEEAKLPPPPQVSFSKSASATPSSQAVLPNAAAKQLIPAERSQEAKRAATTPDGRVASSPTAEAERAALGQEFLAVKAAADAFAADKSVAAQRRQINKIIIVTVGQISASLEQVAHTSGKLVSHLSSLSGGALAFAYNKLAATFLAQCDGQVVNNPRIAFPLAEVAIEVASAHPPFLRVLLTHFHKASQVVVPALTVFPRDTTTSEEARLVALGYRVVNELGATTEKKFEATAAFLKHQEACVRLYAAITQSDRLNNPHGLQHAWSYFARLLNELPGTRLTARALDAYLSVAGWKLYGMYKLQFVKVLRLIDSHFMPQLAKVDDPPLLMKLRSYYEDNCFLEVPEGRILPKTDASTYEHNKGW